MRYLQAFPIKLSETGLYLMKHGLFRFKNTIYSVNLGNEEYIMLRITLISLLSFTGSLLLYSQTCCSGGVPTSGNLGLPITDSKTLQFSLNYDLNILNTQKTGRSAETKPENFRVTHTAIIQAGYSINKRLSVDAFLPWIRQERRSNNTDALEFTSGIGDAILLFKYFFPFSEDQSSGISLGFGPKIPIGRIDFKNKQGNILLADLQPGSGSWDALFWLHYKKDFSFRPSLNFNLQGTYKINGENGDFGIEPLTVTYQFGTELQVIGSISDRLFVGSLIIDPSLSIKYRNAKADKRKPNNISQELTEVPSTGGNWVFISPGLTYWANPKWSFNLQFELPVFADIDGTQVTPTFRINTGVYYRFDFANKTTNNE